MYVCMYVCMYPSLKNARMSRLGMEFYTTTELARHCQGGETEISREC